MNTSENGADASGRIRFDLIAKTNGMDEIRLTYEESLIQEQLVIASASRKWVLYRIGPGPDHSLHHDQIGLRDIAAK